MPPEHHWSYSDDSHGPNEWPKYFKTGRLQSPIDILVDQCQLASQMARGTCCERLRRLKLQPDQAHRRPHLDSVGESLDLEEEHQRSSSTSSSSSASSSSSSSPTTCFSSLGGSSGRHSKQARGACPPKGERSPTQRQLTRYVQTNRKIFLGYPRYLSALELRNTGHAWQVDLPAELAHHTLLTGPSLGDREYRLAQLHCHWGEDCERGSEHLINGRPFSAEIHFVHWNCTHFDSAQEASRHKHGLAVLAVLVQALDGDQNKNKHLDKILTGLSRISKPNSSHQLSEARLDLKKLFPSNRCHYATYEGSLTTPPLSEVVDWIVFLQPIQCSVGQVDQFRQLQCNSGPLLKNCRPIQPLNERTVSVWSQTTAPLRNVL